MTTQIQLNVIINIKTTVKGHRPGVNPGLRMMNPECRQRCLVAVLRELVWEPASNDGYRKVNVFHIYRIGHSPSAGKTFWGG